MSGSSAIWRSASGPETAFSQLGGEAASGLLAGRPKKTYPQNMNVDGYSKLGALPQKRLDARAASVSVHLLVMAHSSSLLRLSVAEKMSKQRDNALAVFERAQNNARL